MRSLGVSFVMALGATVLLGTMPAAAQQSRPMVSPPSRPMASPPAQGMVSPPFRPMPSQPAQPMMTQSSQLRPFQTFSPTIVLSPETANPPMAAYRPGYPMPYSNPNPYAMPYGNSGSYQMPNQQGYSDESSYGNYGSYASQTPYQNYGSNSSAQTAPAAEKRIVDVTVRDNSFHPARIEIPLGTTVQWTNQGQHIHSVTSDENPWQFSAQMGPHDTYRRTFDSPGTYPYHCAMHPVAMRGVVVVK